MNASLLNGSFVRYFNYTISVNTVYCDWFANCGLIYGKIFQSLTLKEKVSTLKFKEKSSEEPASFKQLLFWMVRLIHADPMLMLNVSNLHLEYLLKRQEP